MKSLSEINMNQLYCFWRVARAGSFSSATSALFRSQPALSMQVRQLEKRLGKTLLLRGRQGVTLTAEGLKVFECCERIFKLVGETLGELAGAEGAAPVLRVAAGWAISYDNLRRIIAFVHAANPLASVRVTTGSPEYLRDRLLSGQADIAVANSDISGWLGGGFTAKLVFRTPVYFVGVPALRRKMGRFPAGLSGVPLITRPQESAVRKDTEAFLKKHGLNPAVHSELSNLEMIKSMVLDGHGAGVLATAAVAEELRSGRLVKFHRRPAGIYESVWLIAPREGGSGAGTAGIVSGLMRRLRFS